MLLKIRTIVVEIGLSKQVVFLSISNLVGKYKQCLDSGEINVNLPNLVISTEKYVGRNVFLNSRSQGFFLHLKTIRFSKELVALISW